MPMPWRKKGQKNQENCLFIVPATEVWWHRVVTWGVKINIKPWLLLGNRMPYSSVRAPQSRARTKDPNNSLCIKSGSDTKDKFSIITVSVLANSLLSRTPLLPLFKAREFALSLSWPLLLNTGSRSSFLEETPKSMLLSLKKSERMQVLCSILPFFS